MTAMIDRFLGTAFRENRVASIDLLKKVLKEKSGFQGLRPEKEKEVLDIVGTACLALLKLAEAARYFKQSGNISRLQTVFELAVRHGKYHLVKELMLYGGQRDIPELQMTMDSYIEFLKRKALPYIPMYRDEQAGFSIDEDIMNAILAEIGGPKEKVLAETVEMMEARGSLNLVKKFILAYYSRDPALIARYEADFNGRSSGGRQKAVQITLRFCKNNGFKFVKRLQAGDEDNYFPQVAHIFLVERDGKSAVFKENLRLHQDYSSLAGYSMEKEILASVKHDNIVNYRGSFEIEGLEFLALDFIPGVTLERYVATDNRLPSSRVVDVIVTLARVIDYLHKKNIISMDVKDKNVMYDGSKVILFDFGVSQIVPGVQWLDDNTFITSLLTTPEYVAPEMALTFKAYPKTDIFQLGVLFYKLLCGRNPFVRYDIADFDEGDEYRESEIIKFVLPAIFREMDESPAALQQNPEITALLKAMLNKDFRMRPTPAEVMAILGKITLKGG